MNDLCHYLIQVAGQVDEKELNATSPLEIQVTRGGADSSWLSVDTDQSGLIGLMRHLHNLAFMLLVVSREE